jgi:hypothetical protein
MITNQFAHIRMINNESNGTHSTVIYETKVVCMHHMHIVSKITKFTEIRKKITYRYQKELKKRIEEKRQMSYKNQNEKTHDD